MRRRGGIRAFVGMLFLLAIALVIGLFMQPIFGGIDSAAEVNGTVYEGAYNGTAGIALMVYTSWPIVLFGIGIICVVIALKYVAKKAR